MNLTKQCALLSVILLAGCASSEVKKEQPKILSMNDAQLKSLLVGKTMYGNDWSSSVNSDGSVDNNWDSVARKGTYVIKKNNMYCRTWDISGEKACWTMRRRTNDYYGTLVSGSSESFKFLVR